MTQFGGSTAARVMSMRTWWMGAVLLATLAADAPGRATELPFGLGSADRVLVVAPHPDDETIGAGGLVHRLTTAGVPVDVLFLTSGDGWDWAAQVAAGGRLPTDGDYVALGRTRIREALAAATELGVRSPSVRFLGFPDDGLAPLVADHERPPPFVSPHTGAQSVPYPEAFDPRALYTGEALAAVTARAIAATRPTFVVTPHPLDTHPDHATATRVLMRAVAALRGRNVLPPKIRIVTYLVHHADWPAMTPDATLPMVPPTRRQVPGTRWTVVPLTDDDVTAKRAALERHRTQMAASPEFLRNFVRSTELFGRVKSGTLLGLAAAP